MAAPARQCLDYPVGENQKIQRQMLKVQPFLIEYHVPCNGQQLARNRCRIKSMNRQSAKDAKGFDGGA
jgi:hypothetical protein